MLLPVRILAFAGSVRAGSVNVRLAALAVKELAATDAGVTRISLADYPLPLYDADSEALEGIPDNALRLKRHFAAHDGIFVATPEYNAALPPLLKNALDWVSRVQEAGEAPLAAYRGRVFALGAASDRAAGGTRALAALRQVLAEGCGAAVIPEQIAVPEAHTAFDDRDNLRDERLAAQLRTVLRRLAEEAQAVTVPA